MYRILNFFDWKKVSRVPRWTSEQSLFQINFRKLFFGTLFLDNRFQNHPDSVILQKYQPLSNQTFKRNSAHMPSLSSTPKLSFEPSFCMFIIKDYYTKSKRL